MKYQRARVAVCNFKKMAGASLIEVMIAFFVLGVGLLGVIALQAESLKLNQQSYASTQALLLANDMAERMRSNEEAFLSGGFTTLDDYKLVNGGWMQLVQNRLPNGAGTVKEVAPATTPPSFVITVSYDEQKLSNENSVADVKRIDYLLTVVL